MVPAVYLLTGVAMAVVVAFGGAAVQSGRLQVGVMVAFIFYVQRFFDPMRTLSMQYTVMQRATAARRIFKVLDVPLTVADRLGAQPLDANDEPSIEFRGVRFGYRTGEPVLHGIDLTIAAYSTVALVGPTGRARAA